MTFEYEGGGGWWMNSEEIHPLPKTPLYSVLRWILDQLNTSSFDFIAEDGNDMPVHTIVLGQGAASAASAEEIAEEIQKRSLAVDVAGIFARARERGVEPENEEEYEKAKRLANEYGKMNTEFHYAYELVDILERISKKTFVFDAPAIVGRAAPQTLELLQEATRCYLFGLHRACVAVCRTALEDSLKQRVPLSSLMEEAMQGGEAGELERLINAAVRARVLPPDLTHIAHDVRKRANDVLHQADLDVPDPWQLLLDTRTIVEEVHTRPQKR